MGSKSAWIVIWMHVLLPGWSNGQPLTENGMKGGLNVAALNSSLELDTSPRFGFHAGLYHRRWIGKAVALRAEIFYSAEGQVYDSISIGYPFTYTGVQSITTVHKLATPVLFEIGKLVTLDVGTQVGWLLAAENVMARAPTSGSAHRDMNDMLTFADLSFVCGLGFHPARKLEACIRYNRGLSRVFEPFPQHSPRVQFRSRVLQVTIGYAF